MIHNTKNETNTPAPVANPNQKPRNPFPEWRLPKGIIKASDENLETSFDSCERWGWLGGGLVIFGVIATVAIAAIHPSYDSFWEQWGSAIADSLVAIGVAIEVGFGQMAKSRQNELKRRSGIIIVAANERAAEAIQKSEEERHARVKLEAQLAPRELTKDQCENLRALKGQVASVNVTSMLDFESISFARQFVQALINVGVNAALCKARNDQI